MGEELLWEGVKEEQRENLNEKLINVIAITNNIFIYFKYNRENLCREKETGRDKKLNFTKLEKDESLQVERPNHVPKDR